MNKQELVSKIKEVKCLINEIEDPAYKIVIEHYELNPLYLALGKAVSEE